MFLVTEATTDAHIASCRVARRRSKCSDQTRTRCCFMWPIMGRTPAFRRALRHQHQHQHGCRRSSNSRKRRSPWIGSSRTKTCFWDSKRGSEWRRKTWSWAAMARTRFPSPSRRLPRRPTVASLAEPRLPSSPQHQTRPTSRSRHTAWKEEESSFGALSLASQELIQLQIHLLLRTWI